MWFDVLLGINKTHVYRTVDPLDGCGILTFDPIPLGFPSGIYQPWAPEGSRYQPWKTPRILRAAEAWPQNLTSFVAYPTDAVKFPKCERPIERMEGARLVQSADKWDQKYPLWERLKSAESTLPGFAGGPLGLLRLTVWTVFIFGKVMEIFFASFKTGFGPSVQPYSPYSFNHIVCMAQDSHPRRNPLVSDLERKFCESRYIMPTQD